VTDGDTPGATGPLSERAQPRRLSEAERSQRLDQEVDRYVRAGFRVVSRTPTTAQLVRPKTFNMGCAILGFLFLLAGLLLYLLYYVSKRDSTVYLTVDELGVVSRQTFGDVPNFGPLFTADGQPASRAVQVGYDRLQCPNCGYENSRSRQSCKQCRTVLLT
jgi:hypothetical protein